MKGMTNQQVIELKELFEANSMDISQLSKKYGINVDHVRNILKGYKYNGIGLSEKYTKENKSRILSEETQRQVVEDYKNGKPIPSILKEYDISRENLQYYRNKFDIPERFHSRAVTLKSVTLQHNGQIKTYPSIDSASRETGIPSDFLHKLRRAETFAEGLNSRKDVVLIHDLNRLVNLERASELMGMILFEGTATQKFEWGKELKILMYELGYASEEKLELSILNQNEE